MIMEPSVERVFEMIRILREEKDRTGLSFEQIMAPYLPPRRTERRMGAPLQPRDQNGWRIPIPGTVARQVYNLAKIGKSIEEISRAMPHIKPSGIRIALFNMKNPDHCNDASARSKRKRTIDRRIAIQSAGKRSAT